MNSLRAINTNTIRPFASRHPRLVLLAVTALGVGIGVKYQAASMQRNERAQRASGNYYVAVDRSGGGI